MATLEVHGSHKCVCARNWDGLDFDTAQLKPDGTVELTHTCAEHKGEWCVHVVNTKAVALIRQALRRAAAK
jgi:hypothetical protein